MKTFISPHQPMVVWERRNRYPHPKDLLSWTRLLSTGKIHLIGDPAEGLLETLGAMRVAEVLKENFREQTFYWTGNPFFKRLVEQQGLMSYREEEIDEGIKDLTIPFFRDIEDRQFLNYRFDRAFHLGPLESIIKTACCSSIDSPRWRFLPSADLKVKRCIVIAPETTGLSRHQYDGLPWSPAEVRGMINLIIQGGHQPVLFIKKESSDKYILHHHGKILQTDDWWTLLSLLEKADAILAKDIDILLAGMFFSHAKIFGIGGVRRESLIRNGKSINADNLIYTRKNLSPMWCWEQIKDTIGREATNRYWFR